MELQVTSGRIGTILTVFDDVDERPIDCDFVLPEYLPEIAAVLKCLMRPVVQSHQISGDRVMVDGTVYLQLLYLDEERRCVRNYECSQPFTSAFTVKDLKNSDAVRLSTRVNYVNCRATSPRRVDVHGAFGVRLMVTTEGGTEIITTANGSDVYTRGCTVTHTVPAGNTEKTVSLNEVVELGAIADTLIRNEAAAYITDCRRMTGKVIVKGDVVMTSVYVTDAESGTVDNTVSRIPFSQILDLEGLSEEELCDCRVQVVQCDVRLMQDPAGESRLVSVAIKLLITMDCYRTVTSEMITDAYHTSFPLKADTCRIEPCYLAFVRSDNATLSLKQPLPDGDIAEVVDLWCEALPTTCVCESGQTVVKGQLQIGMLTRDNRGMVSYYERVADYDTRLPDECEQVTASVMPLEVGYTVAGDTIDLRVQTMVHRIGMRTQACTAVTRMNVDDAAPYVEDGVLSNCCLKVCFATAGESIWELARREHTAYDALKAENGLEGDVLERDTMLLIPMR